MLFIILLIVFWLIVIRPNFSRNKTKEHLLKIVSASCDVIKQDPWIGDERSELDWCFFCDEDKPNHKKDCPYVILDISLKYMAEN